MVCGDLWYEFKKLSYCNYTTCINTNDLNKIEKTIVEIFKGEGYNHIPKPPLPQNKEPLIEILLSSPWEMRFDLWVIGLMAGNHNWTILKTSVPELFCRHLRNTNCLRLSELAQKLECNAFYHSVVDRDWGVLLEADAIGKTFASGYLDCEDMSYMQFYNEPVITTLENKNFLLLNMSDEFQKAGRNTIHYSQEEKEKREEVLEILYQSQEKEKREEAWSGWKEINMSGFEKTDEDLGKLICPSDIFWHENNLLYKAFAKPEQLEKDGVRLLFFQVGRFDLNPETEEIWSPITSREDYGIEQDIPW
jgi:hypothetical protein